MEILRRQIWLDIKNASQEAKFIFLHSIEWLFQTWICFFGDKAVTAIEQSDLPGDIIDEIKNARKYAEGRGLRIEVKNQDDVENVKKVIDIKINH